MPVRAHKRADMSIDGEGAKFCWAAEQGPDHTGTGPGLVPLCGSGLAVHMQVTVTAVAPGLVPARS